MTTTQRPVMAAQDVLVDVWPEAPAEDASLDLDVFELLTDDGEPTVLFALVFGDPDAPVLVAHCTRMTAEALHGAMGRLLETMR